MRKLVLIAVASLYATGAMAADLGVSFNWGPTKKCFDPKSPPISVRNVPAGTKTLEITMIDRNAMGFNHGGGKVAYYDISAGVVHMPNGEKLEAHSGIGEMRDNPKYTHVTMRGPTPPGTYKLSMRESLFHGVAAIRLTPTNGIAPKGRVGLLAHSYLLRRRGDSHGCVAFADYKRFLRAFQSGQVDTMIIVPKMSAWGGLTASADDRKSGGISSERRMR